MARRETPSTPRRAASGAAWAAWDVASVLAFVVIGRHTHHHGESLHGVASTAWPFLAGVAAGWVVAARRRLRLVASGAVVAVVTVALGMALRVVAGQGTAVAFVAVAIAFLGALMVGARAAWTWRRSRTAG